LDSDFLKDREFRKSISFGVNYELLFFDNISLETQILYIQQGYKLPTGNVFINDFYNFLNFPVKVGYEFGNRCKFFTKVGISPSVLLNAKMTIPILDNQSQKIDENTFINKDAKKFDFGGVVTLGAKYDFKKFVIMTMVDYRQSFTSFVNPIYFDNITSMKHYAINFSMGVKYKLN
jgi:hypothetical protein